MMRDAWMEVLPPGTGHYASSRGGGGWFMAPLQAWTADENKHFERALAGLDLRCPDWDRVARATGKTVGEVVTHFKDLEVDAHQIASGLVPFPVYAAGGAAAAAAFTLHWDGGQGVPWTEEDAPPVAAFTLQLDGGQGVPWTEEVAPPPAAFTLQLDGGQGVPWTEDFTLQWDGGQGVPWTEEDAPPAAAFTLPLDGGQGVPRAEEDAAPAPAFTLQWDGGQGIPWTEEEHK